MKVEDIIKGDDFTVLIMSEDLPMTDWRTLLIGGTAYAPLLVMDAGDNVVAINGSHDLTGQEVEFV